MSFFLSPRRCLVCKGAFCASPFRRTVLCPTCAEDFERQRKRHKPGRSDVKRMMSAIKEAL